MGARSSRTRWTPFSLGRAVVSTSLSHAEGHSRCADTTSPRSFAADFSPYGVEQLAGGVTEWTMSTLGAEFHRVVKGGNWSSGAIECRASSRFTMPAEETRLTLGFGCTRRRRFGLIPRVICSTAMTDCPMTRQTCMMGLSLLY